MNGPRPRGILAALSRLRNESFESARIALEQIAANKMRSALTALGVVIGILAVTLMGTAIRGIDIGFNNSMNMLGDDLLYVEKWPWGGSPQWWRLRNRPDITVELAEKANAALAERPGTTLGIAVPTVPTMQSVRRDGESIEAVFTMGTLAEFALLTTSTFAEGRFFTEAEARSGSNVVVLGHQVAESLFPEGNPLGKQVRIGGRINCEVVGVFAKQGSFLGLFSFDNQAIVPLQTLRKFHRGDRGTAIRVKMREGVDKEEAVDELTGLMRQLRGLEPDEENDFEVNRTEALESEIAPIKNGIAAAGLVITSLSLFVGAIGIMNITFVSVKERTREIGTRRAIGARRRAILVQFLAEAVAICLVGGLVGLLVATGIAKAVGVALPDFPVEVSTSLVVTGLVVSVGVGVFAGFAPAWQASRLDPATALRHE